TAPNIYGDSGGASLRGGRRLCRGLALPGRSRYACVPGSAATPRRLARPSSEGVPFGTARGRGRVSVHGPNPLSTLLRVTPLHGGQEIGTAEFADTVRSAGHAAAVLAPAAAVPVRPADVAGRAPAA